MEGATHLISAVTYESGEADLTWEDLETGARCGVTVRLTEEQCRQLAAVVPSCVYVRAINSIEDALGEDRAPANPLLELPEARAASEEARVRNGLI